VKRQEGWLSPTARASISAISLRHVLASTGTIAVNVTWMEREFNACQMHCSMYPSILNCFSVIQPVRSKVRHFSTFFAHFGLSWVCPGTNAVNVTWMERGFNAGQTHNNIYPSIFNCLRAIARYQSEIATFFLPPCITGVFLLEFREKFGLQKTRIMELPGSEDSLTIG